MPRPKEIGLYKEYLCDSNVQIPRSTLWLRQTQQQKQENIYNNNDFNVNKDIENNPDYRNVNSRESLNDNNSMCASSSKMQVDKSEEIHHDSMQFIQDNICLENNSSVPLKDDFDKMTYESSSSSSYISNSDNESDGNLQNRDLDEFVFYENIIDNTQFHQDIYHNEERYENQQSLHHNRNDQREERKLLYNGAQISEEESNILIMSFIIRWGLEDKSIEHLLRLIDCHMPAPILSSKYLFLKRFPTGPSMKIRYVCSKCSALLPSDIGEGIECLCGHYSSKEFLKIDGNFFVQLSISDQIQQIMSNSELVNQMRKECRENDIINGRMYRLLRNEGVIGDDDITLQWNTDGVQPFKSSRLSLWPIQACINELPFNTRRDNMILCGLYYGKKKPIINIFMKPFVDELKSLHTEGIVCNVSGREHPVNIKVHTLMSSVDSVARPQLQGIKQFNGKYGCSFCLHHGKRIERGRGSARVYTGSLGKPRSSMQHLRALERLEYYNNTHHDRKTDVQGVKERSVLLLLPIFHIIWSFIPDYMHASLEGVVTTFLKHWTSYENKDKDYYLNSNKRKILNDRIQSIKVPVEITRSASKIDELSVWKASELRSFLLYYSLVCLKGLLPSKYLKHWFLFVYSMTIFLKERFNDYEFENAKAALIKFVDNIKIIYSGCDLLYTINIHFLLHMPKTVEDFGALWVSSTFPFEHYNGILTRFIKGTRSVPQQICRSFLRLRHISHLSSEIFSYNDCSHSGKKLYESMLRKYSFSHNSYPFDNTLRLFGTPENYSLSLVEKITIQEYLQINVKSTAQSFRRLIFKGTVFHANAYRALTVRNNSIAKMNNNGFLDIARILIIECIDTEQKSCVILGELLEITNEEICYDRELDISSNSIVHVCRRTGRIISHLPQNIISKCVCVSYDNATYIIPLVNSLERD